MRCPTRLDPATEDPDEYQRLYLPDQVEPPVIEVDWYEPDDTLVAPDGTPLTPPLPFGFQVPRTS